MSVSEYTKRLFLNHGDHKGLDIIVDEKSSSLAYIGFATKGTLETTAAWKIARVYRQGTKFYLQFANDSQFDTAFSDRESAFAGVVLSNTHSILLDGVNDYIDFGNNYNFEVSQAFSVSGWVKAQNVAAQRCLIAKVSVDVNVYGWSFQHSNTGALYVQCRAVGGLPSPHIFTDLVLQPGVWHHAVLTYAGASNFNGFRAYLDGVQSAVNPGSSAYSGSMVHTDPLRVGVRGSGFNFSGNVNQFSVFNKALSAAEVTELYNTGMPSDLAQFSAFNNMQSWWPLGTNDTYPICLDAKASVTGTLTNSTSGAIVGDVP